MVDGRQRPLGPFSGWTYHVAPDGGCHHNDSDLSRAELCTSFVLFTMPAPLHLPDWKLQSSSSGRLKYEAVRTGEGKWTSNRVR